MHAQARILLLSKYPRKGASSRLRFLQFLPGLEAEGFKIKQSPLFDDNYLQRKYNKERISLIRIFVLYLRRALDLFSAKGYDILWIEGEIFPFLPAWAERILAALGVKLIIDYDDAIFHRYDLSTSRLIRGVLGKKIQQVMRVATLVTVGNEYLAAYARAAPAPSVVVIPTVVDKERYRPALKRSPQLVVGWIGTPVTTKYLRKIAVELQGACRRHGARLTLIGADRAARDLFPGDFLEILSWSEAEEAAMLADIDVGIMPLETSPWEEGKCGYKIIQYMAAGSAVVASYTAANAAILKRGNCGVVVDQNCNWFEALSSLLKDRSNLEALGLNGRKAVEEEYSLQAQLPRITRFMTAVSKGEDIDSEAESTSCAA